MSGNNDYLIYILDQLRGVGPISARRLFSGSGIYYRGKMFALINGDMLYLKADDSNRADHEAAGMCKFRPWTDRPTTLPYYEVPAEVLEDVAELAVWAKKSIAAAAAAAKIERTKRVKRKERKGDENG